jgi:thermolysin
MKRMIAAVLAAVSTTLVFHPSGAAQGASTTAIRATSVADVRAWERYVTRAERAGQLRVRSVAHDPAAPDGSIARLEQFHQGVRVWGADITRKTERGVVDWLFGTIAPDPVVETEARLRPETASQHLIGLGGSGARLVREPELVVLPLDSGEHRLAYTAVVVNDHDVFRAFVDAGSGAEILRYSSIQTQAAVGTGRGVLGDLKKLSVLHDGGAFVAADQHRPPVLTTFDMRGNLLRALQVILDGAPLSAADRASDADNNWSDPVAVDAHAHIGWTYDYFFKQHGRRGLDDHNRPIVTVINGASQQDSLVLRPELLDFAFNAFWCGECGPAAVGLMYFGNGMPPQYAFTTGQNIGYLAGSLDIVAHELTHGVTDSSSGLIYMNESGALNEAFSDMMGTAVEFFYQPMGAGRGEADFILGEDTIRNLRNEQHGARSMSNPRMFGDPDHYSLRYRGAQDNGGVHTNSGIPNHAFYLAIVGGTNRTSGLSVQGVGLANREQIEKVFYRAFVYMLPASASFATARAATIQAARDLYGVGSAAERAITQAWTAVGVI